MKRLAIAIAVAGLACAVLAGCASSGQLDGVWINPEARYRLPLSNVLVIGIERDATARRIYEDAIVAQLAARGIKAQVSYKLLPDVGPTPPPGVQRAVRNAGVDAVMISRTVRMSTGIRITPAYSNGPIGFHGMWSGAYSVPPNIYTVEDVAVETRLFHVKDFVLLWSGFSTTHPTSSMEQTINDFATLLIKALAEAKVIV